MAKLVTLITTEALSPYNANEVFTVTEAEADALLNPRDEKGRKAESKVVKFDAKKQEHADALVAQRGKTEDVEVEEVASDAK